MTQSSRTILVAHEEPLQRQLIDMLLAPDGYQTVVCEDGKEVLTYLRHHRPDLAILSIDLPLASGADICSKMKHVKRIAGVPVILVLPPRDEPGSAKARELAKLVKAELALQLPLGDKNLRERIKQLLESNHESAVQTTFEDAGVIKEMIESLEKSYRQERLQRENRSLRERLHSQEAAEQGDSPELQRLRKLTDRQAQRIKGLEAHLQTLQKELDAKERASVGFFRRRRA